MVRCIHLLDVLTSPGAIAGRHLRLSGDSAQQISRDGKLTVARKLAICELGTQDIATVRAEIGRQAPLWRAVGKNFEDLQTVSSAAYQTC